MPQSDWPFTKIKELSPEARRGVGAHSKTLPGRLIVWAGIWEGRLVRFRTEPKLINTDLYFNTSSNARICFTRDLGACFVELRIETPMPDDSAERLRAFAQQFDTRPVHLKMANKLRMHDVGQPDEDLSCPTCLGSGEMCTRCERTTLLCACNPPNRCHCGMCQGDGLR